MDNDPAYLIDTFLAPVAAYLRDETVGEILVNGYGEVYVERGGRLHLTTTRFDSEAALRAAISNIAEVVGRPADDEHPILEARLPDGSRVHAVLPPVSRHGISLSIRKFARELFTEEALIANGTLDARTCAVLRRAVESHAGLVISGGSGTGKTTLLNYLSSYLSPDERILVIEDATELQLRQDHVIPLETRPPDRYGRGEVTMRELVRSALRMRPDRILVGECRGGEALDMLQAMNTGHPGSMTTVHANSTRDALLRLETMALMGGVDLAYEAVRAQVAGAVDLLVHLRRFADGARRVVAVEQVEGLAADRNYVVRPLARWSAAKGFEAAGEYRAPEDGA